MTAAAEMETYEVVTTPLGILHGREAIAVEDVEFVEGRTHLRLTGRIRTALATRIPAGLAPEIAFELLFTGVVGITVSQPGMARHPEVLTGDEFADGGPSFLRVHDSAWLALLTRDYIARHVPTYDEEPATEHYLLHTSDESFEVLCHGWEIRLDHPMFAGVNLPPGQ